MRPELSVRLLGTVAVEHDGVAVGSNSPRLRTLLALLGLRPGRLVETDALVAGLWDEDRLPVHPLPALQVQVTRLRAWLGDPQVVKAGGGGYTLALDPGRVDLVRFHQAAHRALASERPAESLAAAEEALAQWAGDPFPGLAGVARLDAERGRTVERRLRMVEGRLEALVALDRVDEACDVALVAARETPGRERLARLAVVALGLAGRPQEAAAVYLAARRHLRDLGLEPGPSLRMAYARLVGARGAPRRRRPPRPVLVGRDALLARVRDALVTDGSLVLVEGEAGIGKSALLRAARHDADADAARTGFGGWDDDGSPMAAWHEALAELDLGMEGAAAGGASGGGAPGDGPAGGGADGGGRDGGRALHARLGELAGHAPVLVALDDAHLADSASLGVLRTLARLGVPPGVVVLVAARSPDTEEHPRWASAVADLLRAPQTERWRLAELDRDTVLALAATRLAARGAAAAARLAELVWQRARGHPLYVTTLLDVLAAQPDEAGARAALSGVPEPLRAFLDHRVARLPAPTRGALEALAVLGPLPLAGLATTLGVGELELADRLAPAAALVAADAEQVAFHHDLAAAAVHDAVAGATRAQLHRIRFAGLRADADPFVRLRHAEGAGDAIGAPERADARFRAGVAALGAGAAAEALALFEAARPELDRAEPGRGRRDELVVRRGFALAALGRQQESDDVLDAVVARTQVPDAVAVLAAVGDGTRGHAVTGDPRRLARLRAVRARGLEAPLRLSVLGALTVEETVLEGEVSSAGALAELSALCAALGADQDPVLEARVRWLEVRELIEAPVAAGVRVAASREAFDLAHDTDEAVLRLDTTELLLGARLAAGDVAAARVLQEHLLGEARRHHRPRSTWVAMLLDAALALAAGEVETADARADAALAYGLAHGVSDAAGTRPAFAMCRHWLTGTAPALGDLPARAVAAYPHVPAWVAGAAVADAQAGRLEEAAGRLAEFRVVREKRSGRTFDRAALCLAAAGAFAVGDLETARLVRDALPPDPEAVVVLGVCAAVFGPVELFVGLAEAVLGEWGLAGERFGRAAATSRRLGWAPWAAAAQTLQRVAAHEGASEPGELPLGLGGGGPG